VKIQAVTVIGAGSWGTALAVHLARIGHDVRLWARDATLVADMTTRRANAIYLPDINFPAHLRAVASMGEALDGSRFVVCAVPSHGMRSVLVRAAPHVRPDAIVVSATKGLEEQSLLRMSEVVTQELKAVSAVVALSGPSFALELARELPTAIVAASITEGAVEHVQEEFRSGALRLYGSSDVVGVEVGGAL
jgi:glycerol-3-phosphate dehydrogenase (NAD(P)+)